MTADIKLLPLPKKAQLVNPYAGRGVPTYGHSDETLTDYARANVTHATAAKDAEIERLRALLLEACDDGDEADADLLATLERARTAEARAERLAEALRLIAAPMRSDGTWNRDREACRQIARDALRDQGADSGESDG